MTQQTKTIKLILVLLSLLSSVVYAQQNERPYSDPSRFTEAIAAFSTTDRLATLPKNPIVFVGSSSIRRWNSLVADMAPLSVINRGFGGSNMQDAVDHIEKAVIHYRPRAVVLYEGDNDLSSFKATPDMVMSAFNVFADKLAKALPETRLYVLSIKPSLSRTEYWQTMVKTNTQLKTRCEKRPLCQFIDVATPMFDSNNQLSPDLFVEDRLHMTDVGYDIWTEAIKPVLLKNELIFE